MTISKSPPLTVDAIIEFPGERVVLIKRGRPPFKGMWALPGGFVDYGETAMDACRREALEECCVEIRVTGVSGVYSDPARDPRRQTASIAFTAEYASGDLAGSDDAVEAVLFTRDELSSLELAFDHHEILKDAGWIRQ